MTSKLTNNPSGISEDKYELYKEKRLKKSIAKKADERGVSEDVIINEMEDIKRKLSEKSLKKKKYRDRVKESKTNYHKRVMAAEEQRQKEGRSLPKAHIVSGGTVSPK